MTSRRDELGLTLEGVFCSGCGQEMRFQSLYDRIEGQIAVMFCPDCEAPQGGGRAKVVLCKGPKCRKPLFWLERDGKFKAVDIETGLHHYLACNDVEGARAVQLLETQQRQRGQKRGNGYGGVSRSRRTRW